MTQVHDAQILLGRHAVLFAPTTGTDRDAALAIVNAGDNPYRWRLGHIYTADELADELDACHAAYLIGAKVKPTRFGEVPQRRDAGLVEVIAVTRDDNFGRTAHIALVLDPAYQRALWPFEGMAILLDHLFEHYDTVMFETTEYNRGQFASNDHGLFALVARGLAGDEAVHVPDEFGGGTCDMYEYAIRRDVWLHSTIRTRWCRRCERSPQ